MNINLFIELVKARSFLILFTLIATIAAAGALTAYQTKKYSASTSLVLTFQNMGPFDQLGVPSQLSASYMATQVDIVESREVAARVVENLGIAADDGAVQKFLLANDGKIGEIPESGVSDWLAEKLRDALTVRPSRESRVLTLDYECADPQLAAKVADAFAQAYIDVTLQLSMEPARRNAAWFDGQLKTLQAKLEEQQQKLTNYQQKYGIVAIDEQLDTETHRLEDLSSKLTAAQAQVFDVQSRQLGEQHPEYIRAVEQEASLQKSLSRQKAKVLEIKQQRDELQMLLRNVENTRGTYDAAIQRYYQSSLEAQFNQTNIAVLNDAVIPQNHSSPNIILNMALAVFLGLVLGLSITVITEVLNRRVRVEEDVVDDLDLPMLASI